MPAKTKASAPAAAAAAPALEASKVKPPTPRRRSAPKRKAATTSTTKKTTTARKRKPVAAPERSKAAVAKLQSAIDQLEAALQSSEASAERLPAPPMTPPPAAAGTEPKLPMPQKATPPPPAVEISPDGWKRAAGPALATCAFLVFVGTLIVGYSTGYAVGNGSVDDPVVTLASASERSPEAVSATPKLAAFATAEAGQSETEAAPEKPSPTRSARVVQTPAPKPAPVKAAPKAAAAAPVGGLLLQVSALKSRQAAAKLSERLEKDGYPVQVREPEADGLVRVLVGPVPEGDQLTAMADRLREEGLKPFPKRL